MSEENKAIIRRLAEEWNKGNKAAWWDVLAPECVTHGAAGQTMSTQEMRQLMDEIGRAFSDHQITIEDLIAEGDKVVARYTESGTMTGSLMGMEATGKRFSIPAIEIYRFAGGRIVEVWEVRDTGAMMQQLGVTPPPGPPAG